MRYKTLFRLGLKLMGIFVLLRSAPSLLTGAGQMWLWGSQIGGFGALGPFDWIGYLFSSGVLASIVQMAVGLYLVFGGGLLTNLCIPSNRPYCPECGYELRNLQRPECPECGVRFPMTESGTDADDVERVPIAESGWTTIVPYHNKSALSGYYLAVASLIPVLGMILGPVAVTLGVQGLRAAKVDPRVKGRAHAWVAVVLGSLLTVVQLVGGCVLAGLILNLDSTW